MVPQMDPQLRGVGVGGWMGEKYFSPKTLPVMIKCTMQMEKPEISRSSA